MTKTLTGYDDLCQVLKQCHLCIKNNITEQMTINDSCHKHKHLHFAFMHLADAFIQSDLRFRLYIFVSMCVPWEFNPQCFVLLTQCSTTEPQEHVTGQLYITFNPLRFL